MYVEHVWAARNLPPVIILEVRLAIQDEWATTHWQPHIQYGQTILLLIMTVEFCLPSRKAMATKNLSIARMTYRKLECVHRKKARELIIQLPQVRWGVRYEGICQKGVWTMAKVYEDTILEPTCRP
ncbi:hypothetical protein TNCV_418821 [Trichonephila clavipes]|nr:hypothetical protein TNCV_418821 [Trichonephila clavipes]